MPELKPFSGIPDLSRTLGQNDQEEASPMTMQQAAQAQRVANFFAPLMNIRKYRIVMVIAGIWGFVGFLLVFGGTTLLEGFIGIDMPEMAAGLLRFLWIPLFCGSEVLIVFGGVYLMDRMIKGRLGTPVVQASADEVRRGDSLDVSLLIDVKGDVNIREVTLSFVLRETATYTSGTDKITVTHEHLVSEFKQPGRILSAGQMMEERARFDVPQNAIHTFYAKNNKLNWLILVKVDIPSWPDFSEVYEIRVLPEAGTGDVF